MSTPHRNQDQIDREQTFISDRLAFKCIVGSRLYGTHTETSDVDTLGIYYPHRDFVYGIAPHFPRELGYTTEETFLDVSVLSKREDGKNAPDAEDIKYYELRNFVNLALKQGPNIIELFYLPDHAVLHKDSVIGEMFDLRDHIVSATAVKRFIGYAESQKHKMVIRTAHFGELTEALAFFSAVPEIEQGLLVWEISSIRGLPHEFAPWFKITRSHFQIGDLNFQKSMRVKQIRKILEDRLANATNRVDLMQKHEYDTKFASHLIRLLYEGKRLFETGELIFPLPEADLIRDIKYGKYTMSEVIEMADGLQADMEGMETVLRPTPNYARVNMMISSIVQKMVN